MTHEEIVEKAFFLTGADDKDIRDKLEEGSSFLYFEYYKDARKVIDWLAKDGPEYFSAIWTGGNKIEMVWQKISPSLFRAMEGAIELEFCNDEGEVTATEEEQRKFLKSIDFTSDEIHKYLNEWF